MDTSGNLSSQRCPKSGGQLFKDGLLNAINLLVGEGFVRGLESEAVSH